MDGQQPDEQAVCARCGSAIDPADCFRIERNDGRFLAWLCRVEHVAAWELRGGGSGAMRVVRLREGQSIERDFDEPEELRKWALAGGFWGEG